MSFDASFESLLQMKLYTEITSLNHLSTEEYIVLGSSLIARTNKLYQCNHKVFRNEAERNAHTRRHGCTEDIQNPKAYKKLEQYKLKRCYCNFYNNEISSLINISNHLKKFGNFPNFIVNVDKMSNKFHQAHIIIQNYFTDLENEEIKKQHQKLKNTKG